MIFAYSVKQGSTFSYVTRSKDQNLLFLCDYPVESAPVTKDNLFLVAPHCCVGSKPKAGSIAYFLSRRSVTDAAIW